MTFIFIIAVLLFAGAVVFLNKRNRRRKGDRTGRVDRTVPSAELHNGGNQRVATQHIPESAGAPAISTQSRKIATFVDVKTTGLSHSDEIIEFAAQAFEYDPNTGEVYDPVDFYVGEREPAVPINPSAAAVNGFTIDRLRGKALDAARVEDLLRRADILIAHNASFDRRFVNAAFSGFSGKGWHCSMRQVDWLSEGCPSRRLQDLVDHFQIDVVDRHRAAPAVTAAIDILGRQGRDGRRFLAHLIESEPLPAAFTKPVRRKANLPETSYPSPQAAAGGLVGLLQQYMADNVISEVELLSLSRWLDANRVHAARSPIDLVADRVGQILDDGFIEPEELVSLEQLARQILSNPDLGATRGGVPAEYFTTPEPVVEFSGKTFLLSGAFALGSRSSIRAQIEQRGGEMQGHVSRRLDYLVIAALDPGKGGRSASVEAVRADVVAGLCSTAIVTENLFARALHQDRPQLRATPHDREQMAPSSPARPPR